MTPLQKEALSHKIGLDKKTLITKAAVSFFVTGSVLRYITHITHACLAGLIPKLSVEAYQACIAYKCCTLSKGSFPLVVPPRGPVLTMQQHKQPHHHQHHSQDAQKQHTGVGTVYLQQQQWLQSEWSGQALLGYGSLMADGQWCSNRGIPLLMGFQALTQCITR